MRPTRRRIAARVALVVALAAIPCVRAQAAPLDEEAARSAAASFGRALTKGDPSALRPILPARGKVQLRLSRLGPEQGFFSADQVEALIGDFLAGGKATGFDVDRVELDPGRLAVVRGRVDVTDAAGSANRVGIHLAFQPEGERWVLREVRETAP